MTVTKPASLPISAGRLKSFVERIEKLEEREAVIVAEIEQIEIQIALEFGITAHRTYVVQAGPNGPVKIGRARDVEKRIKSLQTGCPFTLRVIRTIPFDCEGRMHRHFAEHRTQGEWFKFHPDMLTETFTGELLDMLGGVA